MVAHSIGIVNKYVLGYRVCRIALSQNYGVGIAVLEATIGIIFIPYSIIRRMLLLSSLM